MTPFEQAWHDVGVGEIEILDCHGHLGTHENFPVPHPEATDIVRSMDLLGITTTFVSALSGMSDEALGESEGTDAAARFPGRLEAVPIANPNRPDIALDYLERCRANGTARMIKVHPTIHAMHVGEAGYQQVFEFAATAGWPVLSHTWDGDPFCDPSAFAAIASDHPGTTFLLGHCGGTLPAMRRAVEVARRHDNVFLDLAGSTLLDGVLEWMVAQAGVDRVLFGTDVDFLDPRPQLGRVLLARLPVEQRRRILGANLVDVLA